jgi:hypothetical protein
LPPSPSAKKSPDNAVSSAGNTNTTHTPSTAAAGLSASTTRTRPQIPNLRRLLLLPRRTKHRL